MSSACLLLISHHPTPPHLIETHQIPLITRSLSLRWLCVQLNMLSVYPAGGRPTDLVAATTGRDGNRSKHAWIALHSLLCIILFMIPLPSICSLPLLLLSFSFFLSFSFSLSLYLSISISLSLSLTLILSLPLSDFFFFSCLSIYFPFLHILGRRN